MFGLNCRTFLSYGVAAGGEAFVSSVSSAVEGVLASDIQDTPLTLVNVWLTDEAH